MSDEEDFIQQMIRHQGGLYRFILSLVGNYRDAEDLLQQTMLTLWEKWDTRDTDGEVLPWAFAIAKNHVRNHVRKATRRGEVSGLNEETIERVATKRTEIASVVDSQKEALDDCLGRLPADQRELIEAYYEQDKSAEQLAAKFRKSVDAFYKSLQRIRRSLFDCVSSKLATEGQT